MQPSITAFRDEGSVNYSKEATMQIKKVVFALALVGTSLSAAFAADTGTWQGGEIGYVPAPAHSTLSRGDVRQELQAFRRNPVTSDGGTIVGGEVGYEPAQHSFAFADGKLIHSDNIAHNTPRPSVDMTSAERRAYKQSYPNG